MDDARAQRDRLADVADAIDRMRPDLAARLTTQIGRVFNAGAMPVATPAFFCVHPIDSFTGAEVEGGPLALSPSGAKDFVYVLGSRVPGVGDDLIYYQIGDRFFSEDDGATSGTDFTVHVKGCNGMALPGATVVLQDGMTILGTHTSDGSGNVTFTGIASGSHTLFVTKSRFDNNTQTVTLPHAAVTVSMVASSEYVCTDCCADPFKKTLSYGDTHGLGTVSLTYAASGVFPWSNPGWSGCGLFTGCGFHCADGSCRQSIGTAFSYPVFVFVFCSPLGGWQITYAVFSDVSGACAGNLAPFLDAFNTANCSFAAGACGPLKPSDHLGTYTLTCDSRPATAFFGTIPICVDIGSVQDSLGTSCALPLALSASPTAPGIPDIFSYGNCATGTSHGPGVVTVGES